MSKETDYTTLVIKINATDVVFDWNVDPKCNPEVVARTLHLLITNQLTKHIIDAMVKSCSADSIPIVADAISEAWIELVEDSKSQGPAVRPTQVFTRYGG